MKNDKQSMSISQRGLSLVELMVGLAVGLVISLGLLMLVAGTSNAFKIQDDFSRLQENGAAALHYLVDDIRMAGFYGLAMSSGSVSLDSATLATAGINAIANDCAAGNPTPPWSLKLLQPIDVHSGLTQASVNAALPCIEANDFATSNASVIVLRGATGTPVANLAENTLYVQSSPSQSPNTILFKGSRFAALKAAGLTRSLANGNDFPIFAYQSHVYYIRPCSRPTAATCSNVLNEDGGSSIPTLVRHELSGASLQLVPLVEGVERINLLYGIDIPKNDLGIYDPVNGKYDGIVDQFTDAPGDLTQVVAVRVFVLIRAASTSPGYSDAGKRYNLGSGPDFQCTAGVDCNFRRHVFSQTTSVRNCAQRRGGGNSC